MCIDPDNKPSPPVETAPVEAHSHPGYAEEIGCDHVVMD